MINSLHLTWTREPLTRGPAANLPSASSLGLAIAPSPGNTPAFSINGGFTTSCGTCANAYVNRNQAEVRDDVSWIHDRHQITFGGLYERAQLNEDFATLSTGSYSFDGSFTGLGLADFLLGRVIGFSQGSPQVWNARDNMSDYTCRRTTTPANGSHSWAVSAGPLTLSRMTSTAVVRILTREILLPGCTAQSSTMHRQGSSSPGTRFRGTELFPRAGAHSRVWDFAPRLGIAWDPTGSGLWSVRTSYGIFYGDPEMAFFETYSYIAPYGNQISLTSPTGGLSAPYAAIPWWRSISFAFSAAGRCALRCRR